MAMGIKRFAEPANRAAELANQIVGYTSRKECAKTRSESHAPGQHQTTQKIKDSIGSLFTRLIFFFQPNKAEQQAKDICKAAKEISDAALKNKSLKQEKYLENLKTKIVQIAEDTYTNKYLFDRERATLCRIFSEFLTAVEKTPRQRS